MRPVTWGTVYLLPREQRAECGSVMVPITDAWCIGCNTGDTTMNKDIENTELTDQDLENVTGGSLAGLGLTVSNSLPGRAVLRCGLTGHICGATPRYRGFEQDRERPGRAALRRAPGRLDHHAVEGGADEGAARAQPKPTVPGITPSLLARTTARRPPALAKHGLHCARGVGLAAASQMTSRSQLGGYLAKRHAPRLQFLHQRDNLRPRLVV